MSEVSSEAVEAAARALWERNYRSTIPTTWDRIFPDTQEIYRSEARFVLTAALPYLVAHQPDRVVPSAEEVAEGMAEREGLYWPFLPERKREEYLRHARAVLALFASQPSAEEVAQIKAERDAAQEHLRYHLADFRPLAGGNMSGDLAVDMAAYASRLKADLDEARAALASQPTVAEVREQVSEEILAVAHDYRLPKRPDEEQTSYALRLVRADVLSDAARIARTETKGGE